jgi:hypothetical protein
MLDIKINLLLCYQDYQYHVNHLPNLLVLNYFNYIFITVKISMQFHYFKQYILRSFHHLDHHHILLIKEGFMIMVSY